LDSEVSAEFWKSSYPASRYGPLGYGLRIQTGFALAEVCGLPSTPVSSCRCCVLLTDLRRRTEYLVRVQALTVNGSGPATQWLSVQTFANDLDGTAHYCLTSCWLSRLNLFKR